MKMLVTGCAGFIGSNLVDELLAKENKVIGIDNFDPYYKKTVKLKNMKKTKGDKNFKFVECDIRNLKKLERIFKKQDIDFVFHMAAKSGVRSSIDYAHLYNDVNINGTIDLLKLSADFDIKKFIHASSYSVYGNPLYLPVNEKHPKNPISPYGISKLSSEKYCRAFEELCGLKTVCLRFFTVYGPRQRPDEAICKFTDLVLKNKPVTIYGNGERARDFTFITDIINGIILSQESKLHGEVFNLGCGNGISINYIIKLLEKEIGKEINKIYIERQKEDVSHILADISKAKELLNWKPKVDIETGIKGYIEWWENGKS